MAIPPPQRGSLWMEGTSGLRILIFFAEGEVKQPSAPGGVCASDPSASRISLCGILVPIPYESGWSRRPLWLLRKHESQGECVTGVFLTPGEFGLLPFSPRPHDRRCSSLAGWGKALAASNRVERCQTAKAVRPLARETSAGHPSKVWRSARFAVQTVVALLGCW